MGKITLQEEFVKLMANHQKLVHSLCSLYFAQYEDRKDMFQEIVLQLWKAYPAFNHQSKVSTWIYRISLNTVFTKLRKEKSRPKNEPYSDDAYQVSAAEHSLELTQATEELYHAIAQLGDLDKAIIMLYLEEHSYEEIAGILNLSRTNISTRINRIKTKLEKLLKNQLP
ncbi:sigma-70 family RNA polymerase sigma factor [Runella sp. MFBS21]|uniref:RNA polymerase sigma factor n=1 Tax=Runella sp. MFBS21 TaxID=3034018 RepID=UPI0023F6EF49|nr:sigma-70 family RNA polymerase sigma factor [Runella sp. MFBS21]MDF7818425.1 sigma-70 family RNA polymerase sigma factor [Runella sp. MFBS21]